MDKSLKHNLERLYAGCSDFQLVRFRVELEKQLFVEDTTDTLGLQEQIDLIAAEQKKRGHFDANSF